MNILLVSNSDIEGGAARAGYRLHQGLQEINAHSRLLVQTKRSGDQKVLSIRSSTGIGQATSALRLTLDRLPLRLYPNRSQTTYSPQWLPDKIASQIAHLNPDIVNLHWVNGGYLQAESIAQLSKPIVWTLHDMWGFTGGCHYDEGCARYAQSCGACPQLGSHQNRDLSRWVWRRKAKAWKNVDLTIVAPSQWLANSAKASSLFKDRRVEWIPYGIDTKIYRPIDRRTAREILGLPQEKRLILSGSLGAISDKRKGFHLLQPALQELRQTQWHDQLELVVFGTSRPENPPDLGLKTHYVGTLNDDLSLALLYSAADVFVAPSVQDNLPNTVMESLACGTPAIAFNIGGMPDMIEHGRNGYLATPYSISELAQGIIWILEDSERYQNLAQRAREKVEQEFPLALQAERYSSLFQGLLP